MRLLFCCESYYPAEGGVAEVMRQIAERMVLAGHDVTVATARHARRNFNKHNGVEIRQFKVGGNLVHGIVGEFDRYRDFVVNFAADAILIKAAQQWTFDALWPVFVRLKSRIVFIPCGYSCFYEPDYAKYFGQLRSILRECDHLIFYADSYRDIDFARELGLTNFSVLPNGASELEFDRVADPGFRRRLGISDDDFVFLTVGSPVGMKGHAAVAEAFARLETNGRPATLILNGNWPAACRPRRMSHEWMWFRLAGLSRALRCRLADGALLLRESSKVIRQAGWAAFAKRVRRTITRGHAAAPQGSSRTTIIHDWVDEARSQPGKQVLCTNLSRSDVVEAFLTANLFVFASLVEYSPLVLFEAAAAGTPFLSVPVGNAEEIARWTGGGLICPATRDGLGYTRVDPEVLAREMRRYMSDLQLLDHLGRTARDNWRRQFTWEAIAPRYEKILARTGKGADRGSCR